MADKVALPTGYSLGWSGQFQYLERAKQRLGLIIPITLAITIMILFLAVRRPTEVFMILVSVPLALSGGIWILYLLDYNLSIAVAVGFIALAGLAVETSVVMLVYLNEAYDDMVSRTRGADRLRASSRRLIRNK